MRSGTESDCACGIIETTQNSAPHQNAAGWMAWLTTNMPARAEWYMQNRNPEFRGVKDEEYYISAIRDLQQYVEPEDFTRIVGVRFEAWLEETQEGGDE